MRYHWGMVRVAKKKGMVGEARDPFPHPGVLTIGHSNRSIEEFLTLLQAHGVQRLIDVRTVPRSRHNPQFNKDALPASLAAVGIAYEHWPQLGGLRHTTRASVNGGWRNASFRGYADYMQTPEFWEAIDALIVAAERDRVAVMCAEAVPWRCHRSLIADALLVRGISCADIMNASGLHPHTLTSFAKVSNGRITYPPEEPSVGDPDLFSRASAA